MIDIPITSLGVWHLFIWTRSFESFCKFSLATLPQPTMLSGSFYRFFLLGLCVSLLRQWCRCEWKGEGLVQDNNLAVKHLLHGHLRKTRLWRRVVGETRHSRGKGRPAWFLLGILFLSGDVELNPGPKTRAADKGDYGIATVLNFFL